MSIEEIFGSFETVWMDWSGSDEEDSFPKKGSLIDEIFETRVECSQRNSTVVKSRAGLSSRTHLIACEGGQWSLSVNAEKDDQGTTRGSAEVKIEKQTESKIEIGFQAGVEVKQDKDQKVESGVYGSMSVRGNF